MLINNKSIIGFWIWADTAEYEKGDFVVSGDCIYKCIAGNPTNKDNFTVKGKNPKDDRSNFKIYPGEMISTAEEYFNYVEAAKDDTKSQPEDKYISMHTLYEVLQKLYFGVSTNGLITGQVIKSSEGDEFHIDGVTYDETGDPIDFVLKSQTLNNGVLKVSRDYFSDILNPSHPSQNYISVLSDDNSVVILRQYTYDYVPDGKDSVRRRTQELVDPVLGSYWVRYSDGVKNSEGGFDYLNVSSWKQLSIGDEDLKTTLGAVRNTYKDYQTTIDNYKNLTSGYYRQVYPTAKTASSETGLNSYSIEDDGKNGNIYTIILSSKIEMKNISDKYLYKNSSITLSTNEIVVGNVKEYMIFSSDESIYLEVKRDSKRITFTVNSSGDRVESTEITNIYLKPKGIDYGQK